jgi:hypothetical protein
MDTYKLVEVSELKSGPIRHEQLPMSLAIRIKNLYHGIAGQIFDDSIPFFDSFRRDADPEPEVRIWEKMQTIYFEVIENKKDDKFSTRDLASLLLTTSLFPPHPVDISKVSKIEGFSADEVAWVENRFYNFNL